MLQRAVRAAEARAAPILVQRRGNARGDERDAEEEQQQCGLSERAHRPRR
jgi:hypothetical protein